MSDLVKRTWLLLDDARVFGGGQRVALRLARHLAAEHPEVSLRVACPSESQLAAACRDASIECVAASFPDPTPLRAPQLASASRRIRRLLSGMGTEDIAIANSARAQAVILIASLGRGGPPVVNYMHEQESAERLSVRLAHRRSGRLLVVGRNAHRAYSRRLPGVEIEQVNNFLLPSEYEELAAHRHGLGRPPVIGVLARLIPEKGVLELIDELAPHRDSWRELRIAGPLQDETYVGAVRSRVDSLGQADRVRLLGEQETAGFLGGIDVLVVPSIQGEVQPTVVLEALAAGVPAVVRGGLYEPCYDGLPVSTYSTGEDLAQALGEPPPPVPVDDLLGRFGPDQAVAGIERAAQPRRGGGSALPGSD